MRWWWFRLRIRLVQKMLLVKELPIIAEGLLPRAVADLLLPHLELLFHWMITLPPKETRHHCQIVLFQHLRWAYVSRYLFGDLGSLTLQVLVFSQLQGYCYFLYNRASCTETLVAPVLPCQWRIYPCQLRNFGFAAGSVCHWALVIFRRHSLYCSVFAETRMTARKARSCRMQSRPKRRHPISPDHCQL